MMIKINIFLAIYTYDKDIHRYTLTEKIFKHYKNIADLFKDSAVFSFTILGSEGDISKNLALKYFKEEEYFEFDQKNPIFSNDFYVMLHAKINKGMNISALTNADILFWAGSNDYICYDFFSQIIEYYNPENPQIYGIDNFKNGNNAVYFCYYDGISYKNNDICLTSGNPNTYYWWNGESNYFNREKFHYCGGIVGINRKCINMHPDILNFWNHDEGQVEEYILSKPNVDKFLSKNLFYMNVKTVGETEINPLSILRESNKNDILNFYNFTQEFKDRFIKEFRDFNYL
jgi:hypothetical protein